MYLFVNVLIFIFAFSVVKSDNHLDSNNLSSEPKITTNLVQDAFETLRRLIQESSNRQENDSNKDKTQLQAQHYSPLQRMDPLFLPRSVLHESRDPAAPVLGKLVVKLDNLQFTGLSNFKVEQVADSGPCMTFQHTIPKLEACADYNLEYHLFNEIPLKLSEGQLKATLPKARVNGGFLSFTGPMNDWSTKSKFNVTTTVDDDISLAVYPKHTISERFVLQKSMDKLQAAVKSSLPQISEMLRSAYIRVIEMKIIK